MLLKIAVVAGDGIGPEVTDQGLRVLEAVCRLFGHELSVTRKDIGGAALVASGDPLPSDTLAACLSAGAVLLGAVGGPAFDAYPRQQRPEAGLLRLRQELGAFANLRPAVCYAPLEASSPLRAEVVRGTDILIVRELLGGAVFRAAAFGRRRARVEAGDQHHAVWRERNRAHCAGRIRTGARSAEESFVGR